MKNKTTKIVELVIEDDNQELAIDAISLVTAPATYDPLVDVFKSITEGFATQREIEDSRRLMNQYGGNYG